MFRHRGDPDESIAHRGQSSQATQALWFGNPRHTSPEVQKD